MPVKQWIKKNGKPPKTLHKKHNLRLWARDKFVIGVLCREYEKYATQKKGYSAQANAFAE